MPKSYQVIVDHYESTLAKHGDSYLGVDWPNRADAETRYRVHLEVFGHQQRGNTVSVLDLGCGASHLYDYILANRIPNIAYSGLDISERFVALSRAKHPAITYYQRDVLEDDRAIPIFDYVIMNGVLTEKREMAFDAMLGYAKALIKVAFRHARIGLSFNVMSAHVDWERDDLFHLPFDTTAAFLRDEVSPVFVIRNDYGLYEYTVYIYRKPAWK